MHTNTDDQIVMLLKVKMSELMDLVETKLYQKYVIKNSKGEYMLYVKMLKTLYGFWELLFSFIWK